jgi:ribonuclease P protein component
VTASVPEASNQGVEPRKAKATFQRSARLLRHADFERVYKLGRRHFSTSMTVFYLDRKAAGSAKVSATSGLRVGFTVGRALGGAVHRNRMKRRLREAVRLTRPVPGPGADVVINPKKVLLTTGFDALLNEVRQAFVVIERKLAAASPKALEPRSGGM